jgi:acyl carrier protein
MQARTHTDIQARLIAVVESILAQHSIATSVAPESNLADIGLASIDMVNLMLGVEAAFDLMIPQADITPENFRSVATIEHLILKHLHSKAA